MATQVVQGRPLYAAQGESTPVTQANHRGHTFVPAAHGTTTKCTYAFFAILTAALLITGAVLWGLNAMEGGDPSMLLAGQVLTGLGLGLIVGTILKIAHKCLCGDKNKDESTSLE